MRLLQIITRLILGGAQQNTVLACKELVARGHDVTLAYGPIYGPEGSLLEDAKASGAKLVEIPAMRRAVLPLRDIVCYRQLRRLIREVKPDIVHTHSSKAGILGRGAAWAEHIPGVVHTIHGLGFHSRQSPITRAGFIRAERWAAKRCHKMVAVAQAMADTFKRAGIGKPDQFTLIPNGFDLSEFDNYARTQTRDVVRTYWGIEPEDQVIGIVARLDKLKGQEDLLALMPQLLSDRRHLKLLLVGNGWYGDTLRRQARELGVAEKVIFTGLVPPVAVNGLLRAMDVSVLPSYQEGMPRVMIQSLLCSCAIVGYDVGGVGEVCIDGQTGRLVPMGDRGGLAASVTWMLDHPDQRRELVERGRTMAREKFDYRITTAAVEALYRDLLG